MKKFDFVIGNPPYQDTFIGDSTQAPPVYHLFVEEAKEISDKILLITPARFLFNAGATPKAWNEKMLNYDHIKVMKYEQKSASIFPNTDIKGGVTIFYIDKLKKYNPIKVFTSFNELNSIIQKMNRFNYQSLSTIMYGQNTYKFSEKVHEDYKDIEEKLSKGHKYDLTTSIFDKLPEIFLDDVDNKEDYMQIIGRSNGKRVYKWIKRAYIRPNDTLLKYKVILPKSNGSGAIGEVLSTPLIGEPLIGYTQTFISIGLFDNYIETENCLKYIKTKFARTMLGVLKITQDNPPAKWKYVPLQDFTESSDIDRSKSIPEIDRQLYKKYGLNEEEISFIEEKVQEME
ncbi:Eco57I restriction-modification methylase domain-containing protein [Anaerococcus sp. AGMB09787]|uniref:Eco57I restriction-modification methylase domain-containing protein n=1 Tax=Anaerococcus sp. AGMB09787 TaxID=2922869 RepID=UPI001FAF74C2|nr:Eco57I restriction-modification methylase domain-containing protein [Anaerococcus sp. AGMB09787]